jgi:hypothetical protein
LRQRSPFRWRAHTSQPWLSWGDSGLREELKITFVDLRLLLLGFFGRSLPKSRLIGAYVTAVTNMSALSMCT